MMLLICFGSSGHGAHPLQLVLNLVVHFVLALHGGNLRTDHLNLRQIELAQTNFAGKIQVADPVGIDAHGLKAYAVRGH